MFSHTINRRLLALCVALPSLLFAQSERAEAIVINDTAGPGTAQTLGAVLKAVGQLSSGGGLCSGTLISPTIFLTAKHCTEFVAPAQMSVDFGADSGNPDLTVGVSAKFEVADGPVPNLLDGTDIAVLVLDAPVPGNVANPLPVSGATPSNVGIITVGYGWNGVGSLGHQFSADGLRWAAVNIVDAYGAGVDEFGAIPASANIFSTDFDDGSAGNNTLDNIGSNPNQLSLEGTTAPGDSGGPILVFGGGGPPTVVGVLSGGTTSTSRYGDISWWTGFAGFVGPNATARNLESAIKKKAGPVRPKGPFLYGEARIRLAHPDALDTLHSGR